MAFTEIDNPELYFQVKLYTGNGSGGHAITFDGSEDMQPNFVWIKTRSKERTSWDGAVCVALGLMILFMAPLAKIAAGIAIAWGVWTIWKAE